MSMENKDPKIRHIIQDDLKNTDFKKSIKSDWKELKEQFLNDDKRNRLENMNTIKRFFVLSWWLLKQMFFNLTPIRRIIFVFAVVLTINNDPNNNSEYVGIALLLFILMLELKDKIIAKDELEAGRKVQNELLPEENPNIEGWDIWLYTRSANEVGGDLIDYLRLNENKFCISLGDVSGKGLSAALLMAKLQATIRALAEKSSNLSELSTEINSIFYRDSSKKIFASLIHLELEKNKDEINLVNAGHLPPFILRQNDIVELPKGGPALGLIQKTDYTQQKIRLNSNEILFVFSDGLTEARNENGDFYGKERVKKLADTLKYNNAQYFGERFVKNVDAFRGDAKANDDLSLAVIRKL